jgi:histidyl-tRNA synthetase
VKLYYITPIFRYERPQAGRYRQHNQFGYEAFGDDDPLLDAEVIDMAWRFFLSLGLGHLALKLNSIGCKQCRPAYLAVLRDYYAPRISDQCRDCRNRLERNTLRLLDCKEPLCRKIAASAPRSVDYLCPDCSQHFSQLEEYLALLEIPFDVDHRLVRGLDYYTRTVFEIQPQAGGAQSTLGGGGRYDDLIEELGGKPTPAVGMATGIERIILNLKKQDVSVPSLPRPQVFITHIGDKARGEAVKLTARLRQAGIGVIETSGGKSLKAQLRQANGLGVDYALIVGEEELERESVVLRNMTTSEQKTVLIAQLEEQLR